MQSKKVSVLRGKAMRATRLSATGAPLYGDSNAVVTEGFISVAMTTLITETEAISQTNANGKECIGETAKSKFSGVGVEAVFCSVDFALFEMLTGQELVLDENGKAYGITESTEIDLDAVNWALEMWTGAGDAEYGYLLLPRLTGGVISDITVENAAINFTITGANTKPNTWGAGPYAVETVGASPARLRVPMKKNDHRRIMVVDIAPPVEYDGALPVLDPTDAPLTALTAPVTGKTAAITPTPSGEPTFYDFGDGNWDYSETGAHSHTYLEGGTYTITAKRGLSTRTVTVTVAP